MNAAMSLGVPLAMELINKCDDQGTDFDDMSSFFPCEIDDAIQILILDMEAQAPKIVYSVFFS